MSECFNALMVCMWFLTFLLGLMANFNVVVNNPVSGGGGGTSTPFTLPDLSSGAEVNTGWQYKGKDVYAIRFSDANGTGSTGSISNGRQVLGTVPNVDEFVRAEGYFVKISGGRIHYYPIGVQLRDPATGDLANSRIYVSKVVADNSMPVEIVISSFITGFTNPLSLGGVPFFIDVYYTKN